MSAFEMRKTELVYNHVSLWDQHHAECIEVAIKAKERGSRVLFLSCKGMLLGCPVNPYRDKTLCNKCVTQTERTEGVLKKYDIETHSLEAEQESINIAQLGGRDELLRFTHDEMPIGRTVFNNVSTTLGDVFFDGANEFANNVLSNTISLYNFIKVFVRQNRVDSVSVWNGRRSCDGAVVLAAKKQGLKYAVFISGAKHMSVSIMENSVAFQDIRYHRAKLKELYDQFEKSNDWAAAKEASSKYYHLAQGGDNGHVRPYGMPVCSKSFVDSQTVFEASGKKKLAVFVGTYLEIAGVEGFSENLDVEYGNFYEAVNRICTDEEILETCEVVVRWHPNTRVKGNERSKLRQVVDDTSRHVKHFLPEELYDSYKLLSDADVVIVVGTSMAVEAAYLKKKVIFIGNAIFDKFSFPVVSKHQQLLAHLTTDHACDNEKVYKESLVYGYYRLTRSSFLIKRIRYVKRNDYRATYTLDNNILIDVKSKYYLLRLAAHRAGLASSLEAFIRYIRRSISRAQVR